MPMSDNPATLVFVPRFEPFHALRYATSASTDITPLTSPPYDVFDENTRAEYARIDPHNIVLVDYPVEPDGAGRYERAAHTLARWRDEGVVVQDREPSFSLYRMTFTDESGTIRTTVGVIGALEVVDEGAGGVLPHERTTPKAKTDRLDLTRATRANLSPVWGLSLTTGLSRALAEPGEVVARCVDEEGVEHVLERVSDPVRVSEISRLVSQNPVLIADGHHRYAISRTYRDEARSLRGPAGAELTMTYVSELVQEQLSVAAIHRLYDVDPDTLKRVLSDHYAFSVAGRVDQSTIREMSARGCLCLVSADGTGNYMTPIEDSFAGVRDMDSARLEHALAALEHTVSYQHGVLNVIDKLSSGQAASAVLIRPVSLAEIRRTADTGELMPPKSTFFTPKLRTGLVMRDLAS